MYRSVVNEIQPLYRVTGHENALIVQKSPTPALSSETSLPLKPYKREHLPELQGPSRTESRDQISSGRITDDVGFMDASCGRRGTLAPQTCPQNELDKAIEEAQTTKNLVSIRKYSHTDYAVDRLVAARHGGRRRLQY